MNEQIQKAVDIATAYRNEHNGEIPVLVVAHGSVEDFTLVGKFRKDERGKGAKTRADQKSLVYALRIIFAMKGVTSYEVVTKPDMENKDKEELQLTQNILSIFTVNKDGNSGEFFEIEDEGLVPCDLKLGIGLWYSQLLPTSFGVKIDAKTERQFEKYFDACRYTPPVPKIKVKALSGIEAMAAAFAD